MRRALCVFMVFTVACSTSREETRVLTAEMPLHLEDHLDAATFTELAATNGPTATPPKAVEWRFDQPQPDWKATPLSNQASGALVVARIPDGLRVTLTRHLRVTQPAGALRGAIFVNLPDWDRNGWAEVVIRARATSTSSVNVLGLGFNLRHARGETGPPAAPPFQFGGEETAVIRDGSVHTYRLRVNVTGGLFQGAWQQLLIYMGSTGASGSIDLLSVSVVPKGATPVPTMVEWRFDQSQPDWKPTPEPRIESATLQPAEVIPTRTSDAIRVTLPEGSRQADKLVRAGIYVDLSGWRREEWAHLEVRARTTSVTTMSIGLNLGADLTLATFARSGGATPIISDGSVQTYQVRPEWGIPRTDVWSRIGLGFLAHEAGSIDILSVRVVPVAHLYAADRGSSRSIAVGKTYRRSLVTHAPARLEYRVRVPEGGRLQAALGVLNMPVEFRVSAQPINGEGTTILRETHVDPEQWAERSLDLSAFAGQTITLRLETSATGGGAVAFWGSPTLSGTRRTDKPNVIFYVIDGGGADYMSVYGYNRRTTPTLERLAGEGAVFDHAYSNSAWTNPSNASFMTSLHNSVLGRRDRFDPVPEQAVTMAERFHRAGYQTGVFTGNSNASTASGLERGADIVQPPDIGGNAASSASLNQDFWRWRAAYAGQPYWVHFQPTDVHGPEFGNRAPPFGGLFVSPEERNVFMDWNARLGRPNVRSQAFKKVGIDRAAFFALVQADYDEGMAHNDHQLGRLVERLKLTGEWEHTLLIVAADHSTEAAHFDMGIARLDPLPAPWNRAMFRPSISHVPLIVVWPGHIAGGQRFSQPVSMIDVLPTVLELAGLPLPDVMQGQSLAPLLRGQPGWTPQPVILDDSTRGDRLIEVVDGQWGASMWVGPAPAQIEARRPWPVLVYDLWNDPMCIAPVNEQRPDVVEKYTKFLEGTWKHHQLLAKHFKPGPKTALTPEQLERLRALGYIR